MTYISARVLSLSASSFGSGDVRRLILSQIATVSGLAWRTSWMAALLAIDDQVIESNEKKEKYCETTEILYNVKE